MSTLRATNIKHELSATNQIVLGSDGSIGGTLGDTLAAKPTKTSGTTAPSTPTTGDIWYDTNSTPPAAKFYDGSAWQGFSNGLPLLGGWATISNTPTGSYTDADGDWDYWLFASNSTLTVTASGLLDVLVVGGGSDGNGGWTGGTGSAGMVVYGVHAVPSGSVTVTVGARKYDGGDGLAGHSFLGSIQASGGSAGRYLDAQMSYTGYGIVSSITGTQLEYGAVNGGGNTGVTNANYGTGGGDAHVGCQPGVVIVRRPQ